MDRQSITNEEVEQRVRDIVCNYLEVKADTLSPSSHLVDDLGADSLDLTELAVAFEDEFRIEIPDSEFNKMMTIAGITDAVKARLSA